MNSWRINVSQSLQRRPNGSWNFGRNPSQKMLAFWGIPLSITSISSVKTAYSPDDIFILASSIYWWKQIRSFVGGILREGNVSKTEIPSLPLRNECFGCRKNPVWLVPTSTNPKKKPTNWDLSFDLSFHRNSDQLILNTKTMLGRWRGKYPRTKRSTVFGPITCHVTYDNVLNEEFTTEWIHFRG